MEKLRERGVSPLSGRSYHASRLSDVWPRGRAAAFWISFAIWRTCFGDRMAALTRLGNLGALVAMATLQSLGQSLFGLVGAAACVPEYERAASQGDSQQETCHHDCDCHQNLLVGLCFRRDRSGLPTPSEDKSPPVDMFCPQRELRERQDHLSLHKPGEADNNRDEKRSPLHRRDEIAFIAPVEG
jgi:hypothetical protein